MNGIQEASALARWAQEKRQQLAQRPPGAQPVAPAWRDFARALRRPPGQLAVIAEPARRTPEEGRLREDLDLHSFLHACERAGVSAVAVPTDPRFGLSERDHLAHLGEELDLPLLHHDLLVGPEQLVAARQLGACAVWCHAGVLGQGALGELVQKARRYGLQLVVEVADEEQALAAKEAAAPVLCLSAFGEEGAQNLDHALELAELLGPGSPRIVRGPVSGEAGLEPLRGRAEALWVCGPAVMPRDTQAYLRSLVEHARGLHH